MALDNAIKTQFTAGVLLISIDGGADSDTTTIADATSQALVSSATASPTGDGQPSANANSSDNNHSEPESADNWIVVKVVFKREPIEEGASSLLARHSNAPQSTAPQSSASQSALPESSQPPNWAPLSHKPIYPGEPGYGIYKSRVVFESNPVPAELKYCNSNFGTTLSALDKFLLWRNKQVNKLQDGGLRSAPRLIVLDEGEPCMPLHDLDKYTTTLWRAGGSNLGKTLTVGMPNSFVMIRIACPANIEMGRGRFHAYFEALFNLLREYPHNFSVEIVDKAIRDVEEPNEEHMLLIHFMEALEVFYQTGALPDCATKPFRFRGKRHRVGEEVKEDGTVVHYLEREVQAAIKFLPWISEDHAREFYNSVIQNPAQTSSLEPNQTRQNSTGLLPQEEIIPAASLFRTV